MSTAPINLYSMIPSYLLPMKIDPENQITDEQAKNTRMLYSIIAGIPGKLIDLDEVRENDADDATLFKCNSCACIAGWSSAHPYFQAKGFKPMHNEVVGWYLDLSADFWLFGDMEMFSGSDRVPGLSQKREALDRIRHHLYRAGRISQGRFDELAAEEAAMVD